MRQPAVADRFYPGSKHSLTTELANLFPQPDAEEKIEAKAVMVPHAGYIFSGALAAQTLAAVKIPQTVVIIGPNHHGYGSPASLSAQSWDMPLGIVEIDTTFEERLMASSTLVCIDEKAHVYEHSLEVQVPFIQRLNPSCRIVPLVLSHLSYNHCRDLADALTSAIQATTGEVLIVASSDMSHYETRENSQRKDKMALTCIEQMNPEKLFETVHKNRITMCGVIPVVVALLCALHCGAKHSQLIGYTDSGYVTNDSKQVVGYAGYIIS